MKGLVSGFFIAIAYGIVFPDMEYTLIRGLLTGLLIGALVDLIVMHHKNHKLKKDTSVRTKEVEGEP